MKKLIIALLLLVTTAPVFSQRQCASDDILQLQIRTNPTLSSKLAGIENSTSLYKRGFNRFAATAPIVIHVVVNVLYKLPAENISDAQIASQITALNADFAASNQDYSNTPSLFQSVRSGNTSIRFVVDNIYRKATTKASWGANDGMKKTAQGGLNPTSPGNKLNIWVCNMSGGILGYAQFPGGSSATDGVVIDNNAFGTIGSAVYPFNKGRTLTHEVGHWMNLRHIWGDAICGNDFVDDTPLHNGPNFSCPSFPKNSTCTALPSMMTMNYMDYTDDACMYMFTLGQKIRMLALFSGTGVRKAYAKTK